MKTKTKKFQLRLTEEEFEKLEQRASRRGLTKAAYILLRCLVLKD